MNLWHSNRTESCARANWWKAVVGLAMGVGILPTADEEVKIITCGHCIVHCKQNEKNGTDHVMSERFSISSGKLNNLDPFNQTV